MCSAARTSTCRLPAFPIRHPPDQSSVDSSPGPIAASHVLHRFLVPRHPPCALKNLATDARVHYAVLKQRTIPHTRHPSAPSARLVFVLQRKQLSFPQDPTACPPPPALHGVPLP